MFLRKRYSSLICHSTNALKRSSHALGIFKQRCVEECVKIRTKISTSVIYQSIENLLFTLLSSTQQYFEYFQREGDCFCLGHLLSGKLMTNRSYARNNTDDFLDFYPVPLCLPLGKRIADSRYEIHFLHSQGSLIKHLPKTLVNHITNVCEQVSILTFLSIFWFIDILISYPTSRSDVKCIYAKMTLKCLPKQWK